MPHNPTIAAVIFDMDGLMLDTEILYRRCWRAAASEMGFDLDDKAYEQLIGLSRPDEEARLMEHFGPTFPMARFHQVCALGWEKLIRKGIAIKPGLLELLDDLERRGIPKGVATSTPRDEAIRDLTITSLLHRFPVIVTGDEVTRGKPDPEIFLTTCRRLGHQPQECVVLEDSANGIRAAVAAGAVAVLVPDSDASLVAAPLAAHVCADLYEAMEIIAEWLEPAAPGASGSAQTAS